MHENLDKNVNENLHIFMQIFMSFFDGRLKQQTCYSFTGHLVLSDQQILTILIIKMLFP